MYTSIDNKRIKEIKKLNQKKYRDRQSLFLIEGEHLVLEAYKKGILKTLIVLEGEKYSINCETIEVSINVLKYISELETPPKVMGICKKINEKDIGDRILVLDDVQDPGNLGTIIRSAVAFNIDTIVLSECSVDLYNTKVLRATQGMIFNINIVKRNLKEFIINIKNLDYKIYGTKVKGGKDLKSIEKCKKFAIIVGNEGNGVKESLLNLCSDYIYIKMNSSCESLNVSVATSIILYEMSK